MVVFALTLSDLIEKRRRLRRPRRVLRSRRHVDPLLRAGARDQAPARLGRSLARARAGARGARRRPGRGTARAWWHSRSAAPGSRPPSPRRPPQRRPPPPRPRSTHPRARSRPRPRARRRHPPRRARRPSTTSSSRPPVSPARSERRTRRSALMRTRGRRVRRRVRRRRGGCRGSGGRGGQHCNGRCADDHHPRARQGRSHLGIRRRPPAACDAGPVRPAGAAPRPACRSPAHDAAVHPASGTATAPSRTAAGQAPG